VVIGFDCRRRGSREQGKGNRKTLSSFLQFAHDGDQHPANLLRKSFGVAAFRCFAKAKPIGDDELYLYFAVRTSGMTEEEKILASCRPAVSLRDVAGDRNGCASKLIGQTESLGVGE
jgi:hypothetical protein